MAAKHFVRMLLGATLALAIFANLAGPAGAAGIEEATAAARQHRQANERAILSEYMALLALPNHGLDQDDIRRNADHIKAMLEARGIAVRLLELEGSPPVVFGELAAPGAETTVVLYVHYDGQPVNPEEWQNPPFSPVLMSGRHDQGGRELKLDEVTGPFDPDWRLYARSASDDKVPVIGLVAALDALRAAGIPLSVNLKFFFEGEEELGSPHLAQMLAKYKDELAADLWIFLDGPVHASGQNQIAFGVRGSTGFDVTTYGAARPLHSGHYGNYAPNPIMLLAHLLTSMRDEDSRILVAGYYDDVVAPSARDLEWIARAPGGNQAMRQDLGIARSESRGKRVEEAILWPAINIRGIRAGQVREQASNVIVTEATASVGLRLVPNLTPLSVRPLIEAHIRGQGYHIVYDHPDEAMRRAHAKIARIEWEGGYPGVRTPLDHPASRALIAIIQGATGGEAVVVPSMGGSLPIWYIKDILDVPLVMLPIANHDNNQHAENENIRLGNLWRGIEIYAAVLAELGAMMGE